MINGFVTDKLQFLDNTLDELKSLGPLTIAQLESDWITHRAVERSLYILVRVVDDVCNHLIAINGQPPAHTSQEMVKRCITMSVLSEYELYEKMVQYCGFITHNHEEIDHAILVTMVNQNLGDFERFRDEVLEYASQYTVD